MIRINRLVLGIACLALAACQSNEDVGTELATSPTEPAMANTDVPKIAEDACLKEVGRTTKSSQLVVLEKVYTPENSQVKIGAGPTKAPWLCMTSNDGVVASVISTVD